MEFKSLKSVYFVGAGGIGMSAIARYFLSKDIYVAGYDRTPTHLTQQLVAEGANIHYDENIDLIPSECRDSKTTLVIYTAAIPETHKELAYFRGNGFTIEKRAQVLGELTRTAKGLCIAGTHGKTTTSAITAHLLKESHVCSRRHPGCFVCSLQHRQSGPDTVENSCQNTIGRRRFGSRCYTRSSEERCRRK